MKTLKEFAAYLQDVADTRENSWTKVNGRGGGSYRLTVSEAAQKVADKHTATSDQVAFASAILFDSTWNDTLDWARRELDEP